MLSSMIRKNALIIACITLLSIPLQLIAITEKVLTINIKGMTCPFCTNRLEIALKGRPYIKQAKEINLEEGFTVLDLNKEPTMSLSEIEIDLAQAIKEATFIYDVIKK